MKNSSKFHFRIVSLIGLLSITLLTFSQTTGTLTFTCNTTAPSGSWGLKHVLAIWIENDQNGAFIKTKAKYGNEDDHLTSWVPKSGSNLVDAVTGATLASYGNRNVIWDGTNINSIVVTDGTYNVFIEMGWGSNKTTQHSVMSFSFVKGPNAMHLTPTGNANYSNVVIDWSPTATIINSTEDNNSVIAYPNPTSDIVNIELQKSISNAKIIVENTIGVNLYEEKIDDDYLGKIQINLSAYPNGLYMIKVVSPEKQFTYKILLNR